MAALLGVARDWKSLSVTDIHGARIRLLSRAFRALGVSWRVEVDSAGADIAVRNAVTRRFTAYLGRLNVLLERLIHESQDVRDVAMTLF